MPFPSLFQGSGKHAGGNRSSTVSPTPPQNPSHGGQRPTISGPLPGRMPHDRDHAGRATVSLVPSVLAIGGSTTPSPVSGGGTNVADGLIHVPSNNGGGGGVSDQRNEGHIMNDDASQSSSYTTTSNTGGGRRQHDSTNAPGTRKPVVSLFSGHRDRDRQQQPPPSSPDAHGIGRRLSLRGGHKLQPQQSSPSSQNNYPHPQNPQPQPSPHHHPNDSNSHPVNPYLQQQPPPQAAGRGPGGRPLSTQPEGEDIAYIHQQQQQQQGGSYPQQPQPGQQPIASYSHVSLVSQHSQLQQPQPTQPQQPQYYELGDAQPQQIPSPFGRPEDQQRPQQQQLTLQQFLSQTEPSRPSIDGVPMGPPSRDNSNMSQQQQQQLAQQQQQQRQLDQGYYSQSQNQQRGQPLVAYDGPKLLGDQPIGRATPDHNQRAESRQGDGDLNVQQILQDFETLQGKYRKVKSLYFDRNAEIERLQNALAHQRLAQSRTSLDDNEYASRFDRLDGAIKNVAFEIRQSWKTIPGWLGTVINAGAEQKGGREMTVVGRASISRWVVDEILEQFFHPAIDPHLSASLKEIEHNIRRLAPPPQSIEEDDALSTKVCNWRLSTLDALQNQIHGPGALQARNALTEHLVKRLVSSLQHHLHEPAPPGLFGGVQMIVDIAVGLAANLPVESRDVRVFYPLPGDNFDPKFMKGEGGLPPLENPTANTSQGQQQGEGQRQQGGENNLNASNSNAAQNNNNTPEKPEPEPKDTKDAKSKGLGGRVRQALGGTVKGTQPPSPGVPPKVSQNSLPNPEAAGGKEPEKVRVAGFMAVEVRGRSILVKAPVWL